MLILSEGDIQKSLSMDEAINVMEEAFIKYANNDYVMPLRNFHQVDDEDTLLLMPCFVNDAIGLKVATSFPSNRDRNEPVTQAIIYMLDRKTGKPLAIMNGTLLTAIKTAAVSGVAIRHFKKEANTVGLIGTGLQGLYQLIAATESANIQKIYLHNRSAHKIEPFINRFRKLSNRDIYINSTENVEDLVNLSEIVITATTSLTPVIPDSSNSYENKNKLFVGVGSYKENMREFSESLFRSITYYFIDSEQGKKECGDIIVPIKNKWIKEENLVLLSDLLSKKKKIQFNKDEPIVFKTVSMALFDAMIGNYVYKKALALNIGKTVEL